MINANELRIGNIFWEDYGGYKIVTGIKLTDDGKAADVYGKALGFTVSGSFLSEDINPIPLTPELLVKCGFEKDITSHFGGYLSPKNNEGGQMRITDNKWFSGVNHATVDYLHQLQNLYFALTQTELTINL